MKKPRILFAFLFTLLACGIFLLGCQRSVVIKEKSKNTPANAVSAARKVDYYTCSMHPQIHENKLGDCPLCGMALIPVYAVASGTAEATTSEKGEVRLSGEGIRQAGVRMEKAESRLLTKELLIFGTLGYDLNLHRDVVPLVEGRIEKQLINFNQTEVKKGDPLVMLYSTQAITLQEEYLKALRDRWLSTFYERDLLDSTVRLAGEKLKKIGFTEEDLQRLQQNKTPGTEVVIRAPISGSIVGNMVHIGETAKTDMPLYHIVPLNELWFNGQVFEPDLSLLKMGQTVRITTKSFPGEVFLGKLTFIGRSLEISNRTIAVRFTVPNRDRRLLPNLSASGQLEIPLGGAVLSVPNSAVLDLGTRHVVYVEKEKGVYMPKNVKVGHTTPHYTQIVEGLVSGENVVTSGAFLIDAQSQLRGSAGVSVETESPTAPKTEGDVPMPSAPAGHQH